MALNLCKEFSNDIYPSMYCTVGIHPTRCSEFNDDPINNAEIIQKLRNIIEDGISDDKVIAIGEIGLDYDRTEFCTIEKQLIGFVCQMELAYEYNLPIFFHSRNAHADFMKCITEIIAKQKEQGECNDKFLRGVVHSFTGTEEELLEILSFGQNIQHTGTGNDNDVDGDRHFLYIGFNGCSLKTQENCDLISKVFANGSYLNHILLETDAPWCGIKNTHASKKYITNGMQKSTPLISSNVSDIGEVDDATGKTQNQSMLNRHLFALSEYTIRKYDKYTTNPAPVVKSKPIKSKKSRQPNESDVTQTHPVVADPIPSAGPTLKETEQMKMIYMRAAMVKDRNEPCTMAHILQIIHSLLTIHSPFPKSVSDNTITELIDNNVEQMSMDALSSIIYDNTVRLFRFK